MAVTPPVPASDMTVATGLASALQDVLSQLVARILGGQAQDKNGKPLRDVCYMQLPQGIAIDPRQYSNPWTPAGGATLSQMNSDGSFKQVPAITPAIKLLGGGNQTTPPSPQDQMAHAIYAAQQTAQLADRRMLVTTDGSYRPFQGSELISNAYEVIVRKAQGIPADPLPADIQAKVDAARKLLWILDDKNQPTGKKTDQYKQYQKLAQAWADAKTQFALAQVAASKDPSLGAVWPVTSQSLQQKVDQAWDDWRSNNADEIENALDTLGSVGGSIGAYFVARAREINDAWDLGLTGAVPVGTKYAEISPVSWWDSTDDEIIETLTASSSTFTTGGSENSRSFSNDWFNSHSQSSSEGGAGMIFGVTFGADASQSSSNSDGGWHVDGGSFSGFSTAMSDATIELSWTLCTIDRPYLLSELFIIDGWYLPQEPKGSVSEGDIKSSVDGQKVVEQDPSKSDPHMLPMVTTQFLVIRNVKISSSQWGQLGDQLSQYCANASNSESSSSSSVAGGVGFLGFGGEASEDATDFTSKGQSDQSQAGSWFFQQTASGGTLYIKGGQIVGWVGEILPYSPRVDGVNPPTSPSNPPAGGSN